MTSKWLPCKILTRWLSKIQNHHIFWSSAFSVHFRYKVHMSFQDHLSIKARASIVQGVNRLPRALFLSPWKDQGQRFQVQVNRSCNSSFLIFLVSMQSQWKSSYVYCKGTQNWSFGPNLFFHRNFKSYNTSTGSHMFSNVKGHMSTMLNNLNLHLELV